MLEAIIIAAVLAADQITKYLTDVYLMPLGSTYPLWEGVFHFTSAHNTGAAFGVLAGAKWFFLIVTLFAMGALLWVLIRKRAMLHTLFRITLALIIGGALGNFMDRALLGYVRDMLDFRLINFAIFNVADSAVSVGTIMLIVDLLFLPKGKALLLALEKKKESLPQGTRGEEDEGSVTPASTQERAEVEPEPLENTKEETNDGTE